MSSFTFAPGTVIDGTFRIVRLLKQGGMGAVYVAQQEGTGAERALKLMHAHLVRDDSARARFELEAKISAKIDSDHVVDIVAAGIDEEEQTPYIAMELLEGEDLAARIRGKGALTVGETHLLFLQLGHALSAAHTAGIVHRDLKPENIFLAKPKRRGEPFTVKVLDFGIARVMADARLTLEGGIGSPIWMAPEQTGNTQPITPQTDVWAMGLLAFYVMTGKHFWFSLQDETASPLQVLGEIAKPSYETPTTRLLQLSSTQKLPDGFDAWFAKCVTREADARFVDAATAVEALLPLIPADPPPPSSVLAPASAAASVTPTAVAPPAVAPPADKMEGRSAESSRPRSFATALLLLTAAAIAVTGAVFLMKDRAPSASPERPRPTVPIAAGTVNLGAKEDLDDRPRRATVAAFTIDTTEVPVSAYASCVADKACTEPARGDGCNWGVAGRVDHPVNCVNFAQADAYCRHKKMRLPTEEEFELAVRGADDRAYPWGGSDPKDRLCWGRSDTREGTCRVGAYPSGATPAGVLDLAGNVAEWTVTCNAVSCSDERRIVRGGSWSSADPKVPHASSRQVVRYIEKRNDVGFRCVR